MEEGRLEGRKRVNECGEEEEREEIRREWILGRRGKFGEKNGIRGGEGEGRKERWG